MYFPMEYARDQTNESEQERIATEKSAPERTRVIAIKLEGLERSGSCGLIIGVHVSSILIHPGFCHLHISTYQNSMPCAKQCCFYSQDFPQAIVSSSIT